MSQMKYIYIYTTEIQACVSHSQNFIFGDSNMHPFYTHADQRYLASIFKMVIRHVLFSYIRFCLVKLHKTLLMSSTDIIIPVTCNIGK